MFRKNNKDKLPSVSGHSPSIIAQDMRVIGNILSEGVVDFAGTLDGNVRCHTFTLRPQGVANGEIVAEAAHVYGKVKGMIRARQVHLYSSAHVEGVIMHESLSIEDGAYIDGKFKRADKPLEHEISAPAAASMPMSMPMMDEGLEEMQPVTLPQQPAAAQVSVMKKNIRLITQ